jgi:hypothetical protein
VRIERADRLFFGVCDAVTEAWLRDVNPRSESLQPLYVPGRARREIYDAMVARVTTAVTEGYEVCLALYGHPGVCARAGHESIRIARSNGFRATMLPGISCEDCLLADIGVDPAACGLQSYEASVFLARKMAFDPRAGLLLWQIGMLGDFDYRAVYQPRDMPAMVRHLAPAFGVAHEVLLYELPSYAASSPITQRVTLGELPHAEFTWATTLYVPPLA